MGDPYISEIRIISWNFAPQGWALCNGQLLPINQNQALFSLLGTTYGGNGQTTFALPNLRGRMPIHVESSYPLGQSAGEEFHTLTALEMQTHSHTLSAAAATAGLAASTAHVWGFSGLNPYHPTADAAMNELSVVDAAGGGQPHENRQPYLVLNFIIALQGIFPSSDNSTSAVLPFVAEMRMVPFNFAPGGWAKCDGQLLPLSQNTALFSLLGTTYGGNGMNNFALPNFQGKVPIQPGEASGLSLHDLGESAGEAAVTLTAAQTPAHTHQLRGVSSAATKTSPVGNAWAPSTTRPYSGQATTTTMASTAIASAGGGQAHNNMPPYLSLTFIIALNGIFPPRT